MFCKQCGKKIVPGSPRCPYCGRNADVLSGGTGFWDLTTPPETPAAAPVPAPVPAPVQIPEPQPVSQPVPAPQTPPPVVEREPAKSRKSSMTPLLLLLGIVVLILVIALAVTAVRAGRLSDRLEEANAELAIYEAEAAQTETAEPPASTPVSSPVITPTAPEASEEPSPEPSPAETPEPSPEPSPEPTPEPESTEEPAEAQPAGIDNVAENPAAALTAALSGDLSRVTLTVDAGELKVAEYQWIIVYDDGLETVEDCLKVLAETQTEADPTVVKAMKDQVDPYDSSSGKETQELDLTVFYPDHTAFGKRVFCKMTLEDGSVQCSRLIYPGPEAAKDYVITRQRKDTLTAEVTLPEDMEAENISVSYMELIPLEEISTADMQDYEPGLRLEIPLKEEGAYYVILGTGDAVYPITEAVTME